MSVFVLVRFGIRGINVIAGGVGYVGHEEYLEIKTDCIDSLKVGAGIASG